jgi:putative MATE family efflux protein
VLKLDDVDRRLIALALPAFGALAAEPMYRLVDTVVVARVGTLELGGVAIASAVLSLVIAGSNFLAYGTTQLVAHRLGADDRSGAAEVAVQATWLAVIIGICAVPVLLFGARPLALAMGASTEVVGFAVTYLQISSLSVPFVVVGLAAQGTQRGAYDFRSSLTILVAANILNAVLEVVVVLGFDRGVAGAAWSTVVAQVLAGAALWWRARRHMVMARTHRPLWSEMRPLLAAGRHLLLRVGAMLGVFTGATAIAARIDEPTLAAHQIAMTLFLFLGLSLDALAVPTQTLVADELGRYGSQETNGLTSTAEELDQRGTRQDPTSTPTTEKHGEQTTRYETRDAGLVAQRAVRLSVVVGVAMAIVLVATSPLLSRAFTDDAAVVSRATVAIALLGATLIPGSIAFATDGALIGAGDYRFLGRAALVYLLAVAPIAGVVLAVPSIGIVGIWCGLLIWMILRAVVNARRTAAVLPAPSSSKLV